MGRPAHSKRDDGQNNEVGASHKVGDLVELECEGDRKAYELIYHRNDESDGEVVVVQDVDGRVCRHSCWCIWGASARRWMYGDGYICYRKVCRPFGGR